MLPILFTGAVSAAAAPPVATVSAGVGMAELAHAEVGAFVRNDLELHLRAGTVVFNALIGPGISWRALGEPRGHAWLWSGYLRMNPFADPVGLQSGGEILAATAEIYTGYSYTSDRGLLVRARGGALLYADDGLAAGPNLHVSLGYAFGGG